jgi:hypothetical protein
LLDSAIHFFFFSVNRFEISTFYSLVVNVPLDEPKQAKNRAKLFYTITLIRYCNAMPDFPEHYSAFRKEEAKKSFRYICKQAQKKKKPPLLINCNCKPNVLSLPKTGLKVKR